ncbi:MAG: type II toxin-antitoxin system RelE/ParE family toxin [Candidatus Aenigmatarchaeota archaeon]
MYQILFSLHSKKQFDKLDKKTQEHIVVVLDRIKIRPEKFVKKLVGFPGYRLRVGDHRIILAIEKDNLLILVLKIGHRKNKKNKLLSI